MMRNIPTTKTQLEKLRLRARELRGIEGLKLSAAQEKAATEAGYDDWHHAVNCRKQQEAPAPLTEASETEAPQDDAVTEMMRLWRTGNTATKVLPVKGGGSGLYFYHVEIEGQRFHGAIGGDGPYIQHDELSSVDLGPSAIYWTAERYTRQMTPGWFICKYGPAEPRISLEGLSPAGRRRLAFEFGLPIYPAPQEAGQEPEASRCFSPNRMFYRSPAFRALCAWADKRPRKAKEFTLHPGPYLFEWVKFATSNEREALLAHLPAESRG